MKYALELLDDAGFFDCKPMKSPMDVKHRLSLLTKPLLDDVNMYRRLVGKLIYLTISRPDLAYPVHILSQFVNAPTDDHLQAAHCVLRYIKNAPGIFFQFSLIYNFARFVILIGRLAQSHAGQYMDFAFY